MHKEKKKTNLLFNKKTFFAFKWRHWIALKVQEILKHLHAPIKAKKG